MKRFLLSVALACAAVIGFAQNPPSAKLTSEQLNFEVKIPVVISEQTPTETQMAPLPSEFVPQRVSLTETQIGNTYYDLHTNAAIQRRIIRHSNNTITATWTYSGVADWTTRGTGYNYFNGTTWGSIPTIELENPERTGWPNPLITGQGKEIIISHSTISDIYRKVQRNTVGSGNWTQNNMTNQNGEVWNRSSVGGPNNNTIHIVGMTTIAANGGTPYNGMDGAFLYSRSTDGGASFDITDYQIPGTDSSWTSGFGPDRYAIDARGNTVAIVSGNLGTGVQLYKSTNNGVTWTKTDVLLSSVWFDETTTLIDTSLADRLWTSDGAVTVLIDDNDMCHVWFGSMYIANTDLTDGTYSYYPYTNSIEYWNEDFPEGAGPLSLVGVIDMNANGVLDLDNPGGRYAGSGLVSQPQAGIANDGCIYVTYTGIREDLTNGSQNYRHTYVMRSCDNGCSWSFPIDVTGSSANTFVECAFPSIARSVDDDVHIIYMADNEPGIAVSGDEDSPGVNKIIYLKEDVDRFDTVDFCPTEISGDSLLCLGGSVTLHALGCASAYFWSGPNGFSSTNQTISASAFGTYTCTYTTSCGSATESVNVVAYSGTGGPNVTLTATQQNMCPGDVSVLNAISNVAGVSYLWSTGATTSTISVTAPGAYTVTVQDCNGGTTVENVSISQPSAAPQVIITGDLGLCTGDQNTLTVIPVSGGSYLWSTGSTTTSTNVSAAGTYTCIIQNCAGTSQNSVTVTVEAPPTAGIEAPEIEACEGQALVVTASGGVTYEWSDGSTTANFSISDPSESGTYTVTVSNDCGDTDSEEITLTIHSIPAAPSVTFDGTNYASSYSGGTHTWFVNGTMVAGQTGATLPGVAVTPGSSVYCIYEDDNGCASATSNTLVGINESAAFNDNITIFPNPNNGQFEVRFGSINGEINLQVVNALGQTVYSSQLQVKPNQIEMIDLSDIETGAYLLQMEGAAGKSVQSVIIQ